MRIDNQLPGGNIIVEKIDGHNAVLKRELRDTAGNWFYWKFRAEFDEPGDYVFQFLEGASVGNRGAAISVDKGKTWTWGGVSEEDKKAETFRYHAATAGEVWFCVCVPYMKSDWDAFMASMPEGTFRCEELCRSRKGRSVELLTWGNGPKAILVTTRHHCQESMATHSLEGMLREVAAHPNMYKEYTFYAVPFVDKDGVEDGDQGKNRKPHDHARDYGPDAIYPEVKAIMALAYRVKPMLLFDMHCPWLRSPTDIYTYFVGQEDLRIQAGITAFSSVLEIESPASFPHHSSDDMPFGVSWNTSANYTQGKTLVMWAAGLPWEPRAQSIEIPFANLRDLTVDATAAKEFGAALARTILKVI